MKSTKTITIKICLIILLTILTTTVIASVVVENPDSFEKTQQNINLTRQEKFINEFKSVINDAKAYAEKHYQPNAAMVFDIDETTLDNREYFLKYKGYSDETWAQWVKDQIATPLEDTVNLINWGKNKGYKIFFITGRANSGCEDTKANLTKYNIPFDKVICKPDDSKDPSNIGYKSSAREKLTKEGYKIIINVGDQYSDLKGGFGKGFKLPNPIYNVP